MSKVESVKRGLNDRIGKSEVGLTEEDVERLGYLLEERTYYDAAKRAGVSESAIKQTMSKLFLQQDYVVAPLYKIFEQWKTERSRLKKSKKTRSRKR